MQNKTLKHAILLQRKAYSSTYGRFLSFDTFQLKSIKIEPQNQTSIIIDNRKKVCDRLLSISDTGNC